MKFTRDDLAFLKKMRISPGDLCRTCKGLGCLDCRGTGDDAAAVKRKPETGTKEGAEG